MAERIVLTVDDPANPRPARYLATGQITDAGMLVVHTIHFYDEAQVRIGGGGTGYQTVTNLEVIDRTDRAVDAGLVSATCERGEELIQAARAARRLAREVVHEERQAQTMPLATGRQLDRLAYDLFGLGRAPMETDDELRARVRAATLGRPRRV